MNIQENDSASPSRRSRYEEFSSTAGTLRVTEYFDVGAVLVKYGALSGTVIRSLNAQSHEVYIALRLTFKEEQQTSLAILDEDELEAVDAALGFLIEKRDGLQKKAATYTEADFKTRTGFTVGLYVKSAKNGSGQYADFGRQSCFFHDIADLRQLVADALFRIELLRAPADQQQRLEQV